jgi:hypothetical protein
MAAKNPYADPGWYRRTMGSQFAQNQADLLGMTRDQLYNFYAATPGWTSGQGFQADPRREQIERQITNQQLMTKLGIGTPPASPNTGQQSGAIPPPSPKLPVAQDPNSLQSYLNLTPQKTPPQTYLT